MELDDYPFYRWLFGLCQPVCQFGCDCTQCKGRLTVHVSAHAAYVFADVVQQHHVHRAQRPVCHLAQYDSVDRPISYAHAIDVNGRPPLAMDGEFERVGGNGSAPPLGGYQILPQPNPARRSTLFAQSHLESVTRRLECVCCGGLYLNRYAKFLVSLERPKI